MATSLVNTVEKLKAIAARKFLIQFPSYYIGTPGHVSAEAIQSYIERAKHGKGRR